MNDYLIYYKWDEMYNNTVEFVDNNGCFPLKNSVCDYEKSLGVWCDNQKVAYKNGKLNKNCSDVLSNIICWNWDIIENWKELDTQELKPIKCKSFPDEPSISLSILTNNCGFKTNKKHVLENQWNSTFNKLILFVEVNKRFPLLLSKIQTEKSLALWCRNQRTNKRLGKLSKHKMERLQNIKGWVWGVDYRKIWDKKLYEAKRFIETHNKIPSQHSKDDTEKRIGVWIYRQKKDFKNGILDRERFERLKSLSTFFVAWI